jgi:hypothetical protein
MDGSFGRAMFSGSSDAIGSLMVFAGSNAISTAAQHAAIIPANQQDRKENPAMRR